jgi:hypothetical protein
LGARNRYINFLNKKADPCFLLACFTSQHRPPVQVVEGRPLAQQWPIRFALLLQLLLVFEVLGEASSSC